VCCSVLQCVAVCCSVLQCVAVCCSVLQCVAVCCAHLYARFIVNNTHAHRGGWLWSKLICVLQCMCCSVLQCVAVCCSVLCPLVCAIQCMYNPLYYFEVRNCARICARRRTEWHPHTVTLGGTRTHTIHTRTEVGGYGRR